MMKFYYVYILQNKINLDNLYIGFSENLRKRILGHKSGDTKTTKNKEWELIYYESYRNKADALGRERFLKGSSGRKYIKKQLAHYFSENN